MSVKNFTHKFILFVLAIAACVSIVGAGFCIWVFAAVNSTTTVEVSLNVMVSAGGEYSTAFVTADLPTLVVLDGGSTGGVDSTRTGINFYKSGNSGYKTIYDNSTTENPNTSDGNEVLLNTEITIQFLYLSDSEENFPCYFNVEVPAKLQAYIQHSTLYYSYVKQAYTIDADTDNERTEYWLDLKALAQDWGGAIYGSDGKTVLGTGYSYQNNQPLYSYTDTDGTSKLTTKDHSDDTTGTYTAHDNGHICTFKISTTVLNMLFCYTEKYKGNGLLAYKTIYEQLFKGDDVLSGDDYSFMLRLYGGRESNLPTSFTTAAGGATD